MNIAILTSGILPVPAVQGGAVENLIDYYLEYNNLHRLHDITIYSVWHPDVAQHPALKSNVNHYVYINVHSFIAKIIKRSYKWFHHNGYYFYTIEYFIDMVLRKLKHKKYDVILIENRPGYALKLIRKTDAKLVYHLHNGKLDSSIKEYQAIYDAATRIITVSDYITNCVKSINHQDTKAITVHNGIDQSAFSLEKTQKEDRNNYDLNADDFIIFYSGRITYEKGIAELLTAMIYLKNKQKIKLLLVGDVFYGTKATWDSYLDKVKSLKDAIGNQVITTGFVPYDKIPSLLAMSDVAVIPSIWDEPFGLTVAEAQAMGKPIITTRRGGIPEVVSKENAILLETDEHFVDNLAAAILDLYQHPEKRQKMSAASFARSKMFDKETFARNFFAALEKL
jgi:glycosyltransferase involved in cell wall biosynthesis